MTKPTKSKWFSGSEYKDYLAHAILFSAFQEVACLQSVEASSSTEQVDQNQCLFELSAEAQLATCLSEQVKSKLFLRNARKRKSTISMHKIEERLEELLNSLVDHLGCKTVSEATKLLKETKLFNQSAPKMILRLDEREAQLHQKFCKLNNEISQEMSNTEKSIETSQESLKLDTEVILKRAEALELRSQFLELEVLSELYSEDKVKALDQISNHMEREIQRAETELKQTEMKLVQYKALGPEFHSIITEYRQIKKLISSNEFVLYDLNDSEYK